MNKNKGVVYTLLVIAVLIFSLLYSAKWFVQYAVNQVIERTFIDKEIEFQLQSFQLNLFNASITASDMTLTDDADRIARVDTFHLNYDFLSLFKGELAFDDVSLVGVTLDAEFVQGQIKIAGIYEPNTYSSKTDLPTTQLADVKVTESTAPFDWPVQVKQFSVRDGTFNLNAEQTHQLMINEFKIDDFEFNNALEKIQLTYTFDATLNTKKLQLKGDIKQVNRLLEIDVTTAEINAELSDFNQWLPLDYQGSKAQIKLDVASLITVNDNRVLMTSENLDIHISNTAIPFAHLKGQILDTNAFTEQLSLLFNQLSIGMSAVQFKYQTTTGEPTLNSELQIQLDDLLLADDTSIVMSFKQAALEQATLNLTPEFKLSAQQFRVSDIVMMDFKTLAGLTLKKDQPIAPFATINEVNLTELLINTEQIKLKRAEFNTEQITVYRTAQNTLANFPLVQSTDIPSTQTNESQVSKTDVSATTAAHTTSEPKIKTTSTQQPVIDIQHVEMTGTPKITVYDFATTPAVEQVINVSTLSLSKIVSQPETSMADFILKADMGKRSLIDITGAIAPFNNDKNMRAQGKIKRLNLTPYSPYVSGALGYDIEKGLLFADFDFTVQDQLINGHVKTEIKAIELSESLNLDDSDKEPGMVPLNLALQQLSDDKGNLIVTVPLTGNVNDPNFGLSGLIEIITTKALTQGAKNYLVQTLLPYSTVVSVAMLAGDALFEISVNDLPYNKDQVEMLEQQQAFADELGKLLTDKPAGQLAICPTVVFLDDTLHADERKRLAKMGQQRVDIFIDYLVDKHSVDDARLIPCKSKIRSASKATDTLAFNIK